MAKVLPYESPSSSSRDRERDDRYFLIASLTIGALTIAMTLGLARELLRRAGTGLDAGRFGVIGLLTLLFCLPGLIQAMINLTGVSPHKRLSLAVLLLNLAPFAVLGVVLIAFV